MSTDNRRKMDAKKLDELDELSKKASPEWLGMKDKIEELEKDLSNARTMLAESQIARVTLVEKLDKLQAENDILQQALDKNGQVLHVYGSQKGTERIEGKTARLEKDAQRMRAALEEIATSWVDGCSEDVFRLSEIASRALESAEITLERGTT